MSTVLLEREVRPAASDDFVPPEPTTERRFWPVILPPVLVALVATALAIVAYQHFLEVARGLWYSPEHDRNAHYWFALTLALDFRGGDVLSFLNDVHQARVWGPLHPLLAGVVLAIGGLDYRLAVLPNLACWVGTAVFAFLAARRATPRGGNLAGAVAALLVMASPAHQAFATDIMLESMGACLTLAALYFFQVAYQDRRPWAGRCFALALTLLFLLKYNYWLLVVLGITATGVAARPGACWQWLKQTAAFPAKAWLVKQLRHPLNYLLVILLTGLGFQLLWGGESLNLAGLHISMKSPHNLIHVIFVVLVLRLGPWWWHDGRAWARQLTCPARQLVYWHAWPVVVWFLWPQRLGYFLWYLSRNHGEEGVRHGFLGGIPYYGNSLADHYHQGVFSLAIVLALIGIAALCWRRWNAGGIALLGVGLVAAGMTFYHPTLRSRFMHSWLAVFWVAAGVGLAQVVYSHWTVRWQAWRPVLALGLFAGLAVLQFPGMIEAGRAPEGGPKPDHPQMQVVTDTYLPHLDAKERALILSNRPIRFLSAWSYLERFGRNPNLEVDLKGFGARQEENQRAFAHWLQTTHCDCVVFVHIAPESIFHQDSPYPSYIQFRNMLAGQSTFGLEERWQFPEKVEVTLWRRAKK